MAGLGKSKSKAEPASVDWPKTALDRAMAKFAALRPGQVVTLEEDEEKAYNEHVLQTLGSKGESTMLAPHLGPDLTLMLVAEPLAQQLNYNLGNALMAVVRGDLHKALNYIQSEIRREDDQL